MFCRNCGEQMNDNQAICIKCGVKTGDGNAFCQNCGNPVAPEAEACLSCGVALKKPAAKEPLAGQNKIVMILLAIFIGGWGIHNFMMGETKKGIVKIVTSFLCGIGSILGIVDAIRIAIDKYDVDPEKLF